MSEPEPLGSLAAFGPDWAGCRIEADELIVSNGERYRISELEHLRWELNALRTLNRALQRDVDKSGKKDAVVFDHEELKKIREVLRVLDWKLPGASMQELPGRRTRRA